MRTDGFSKGLIWRVGIVAIALATNAAHAQKVLWENPTDIEIQSICDYCITSATDSTGNLVAIATGDVNNVQNTKVVRFRLDGTVDWEDTIDASEGRGIAIDPNGNILVVGAALAISPDLLITKYTATGGIVWRRAVSPGYDASGIGSDAQGNVMVVGTKAGRMFAMKHDASGDFQWFRPIDPPSGTSEGRAIVVLPTGESVIAGTWRNTGAGTGGTLLARVDAAGGVTWQHATTLAQTVYSLALDSAANPVVSGGNNYPGGGPPMFQVLKYSAAGAFQWSRELTALGGRAYQVAVDSGDNVVAVGVVDYPSFRGKLSTTKYDPAGTLLWSREIDTAGMPSGVGPGHGVLIAESDEVVVAGYAIGAASTAVRVARYNPHGSLLWDLTHQPTPVQPVCAFDITLAPNDSVYVSGMSNGCLVGGNIYVAKIQDDRILTDGFED